MDIGLLLLFLFERFERDMWGERRRKSGPIPQKRLGVLKERMFVFSTFGDYFHKGFTQMDAKRLFDTRISNVRKIFRVWLIA